MPINALVKFQQKRNKISTESVIARKETQISV